MTQVVIVPKDHDELSFLQHLMKKLNIAMYITNDEIEDTDNSKEAILSGLKDAMEEVQLHQAGKIKLQTAKEWLNGL
jgi:hypothetical protein